MKKLFHIISYLQYPFLLGMLYYAIEPHIFDFTDQANADMLKLKSVNNMLIFLGLAMSFSSLQDPTKTSMKFEKKIWENPRKGKIMIIFIVILALVSVVTGILGYFSANNEMLKEMTIGFIVIGLGMIGFIKTAVETFENHRIDKEK